MRVRCPRHIQEADTSGGDGATRIRFFLRILVPLSRPALTTVTILAFVTSWNACLPPLVVFTSQSHFTLPPAVANFQSTYTQDTARVFAFTALSMLPALAALTPVSVSYRRRGADPAFPGLAADVDWMMFSHGARNAMHAQFVGGPDGLAARGRGQAGPSASRSPSSSR